MERLKEEERVRGEIEMELFFLLKAHSKDNDPVSHRLWAPVLPGRIHVWGAGAGWRAWGCQQ